MRVAIVGGKLQGVEAAFLAHEAGWEAVLIDKEASVPASGLCRSFHQCDVVKDVSTLPRIIEKVDLIIPALEDVTALRALHKCAADANVPLAYDAGAYFITHSKKRSNRLFEKLGIPQPQSWPQCGLPLLTKPSTSSGSQGVSKISTEKELDDFIDGVGIKLGRWILQEYVEGPSYSIEVLGSMGHYMALQVTELEMDEHYDCRRVIAPAKIPGSLDRHLKETALTIARGILLKGIMDVEFILDKDVPKVLEIDARLPSQTPTAVYWSTGLNLVEELAKVFLFDSKSAQACSPSPRAVIYEHIRVSPGLLEVAGEHIMSGVDPLHVVEEFFGANDTITNYSSDRDQWVATLIICGTDREEAWSRREEVIRDIRRAFELEIYRES